MTPIKHTQLCARLNELHEKCKLAAQAAVDCALEIGRELIKARADVEHGGFLEFVDSLSFGRSTAYKYMKVAELFDAKAERLKEGKTLSDLYREFGLIAPLAGGGHRSETFQNGESFTRQLEMCFNGFSAQLETFRKVPITELSKVSQETLTATRQQLVEALALVENALTPAVDIAAEMALLADEKESPGTGEPMTPANPETPIQA
jgi:hypothetical protein